MHRPLTEALAELRVLCRRLDLPEQTVLAALIRRGIEQIRNQVILEAALRISIIKEEFNMPRRPAKPASPTPAPAPAESAAAEMALDDLDALSTSHDLDSLGASPDLDSLGTPETNSSEGVSLDSLAQGVDQASIARALGAVGGTVAAGPDPVVAQALVDLKAIVSGFTNRFDMLESKIASLEKILMDGQIGIGKQLKGFIEEWKTGHVAILDAIEGLGAEEAPAPAVPPVPAAAPEAPSGKHMEILKVLNPALSGRPNFNYKTNPAVAQALAAAVLKHGVKATGEECIAALRSVGRVREDGTIVNQ